MIPPLPIGPGCPLLSEKNHAGYNAQFTLPSKFIYTSRKRQEPVGAMQQESFCTSLVPVYPPTTYHTLGSISTSTSVLIACSNGEFCNQVIKPKLKLPVKRRKSKVSLGSKHQKIGHFNWSTDSDLVLLPRLVVPISATCMLL